MPELWPTHLRLRGSGFVNAVGRIVAAFTPYGVAVLLTRYGSVTVFIVLGVLLLLCSLVLFVFGIETRMVSLEDISSVGEKYLMTMPPPSGNALLLCLQPVRHGV